MARSSDPAEKLDAAMLAVIGASERLVANTSPQGRRKARKDFLAAVNAVRKIADKHYPPIRTETAKKKAARRLTPGQKRTRLRKEGLVPLRLQWTTILMIRKFCRGARIRTAEDPANSNVLWVKAWVKDAYDAGLLRSVNVLAWLKDAKRNPKKAIAERLMLKDDDP